MAARSHSTLRIVYPILLYGGLCCLVLGIRLGLRTNDGSPILPLIVPGAAAALASAACMGVLLHRSWRRVEIHAGRFVPKRRTLDPAAAVVLTFLPPVNIVGIFFSLGRLPAEVNRLAKDAGLDSRVPAGLGYAAALMFLCTPLPVVGLDIGLAAAVIVIPYLVISCSGLAESAENRLGPGPPPVP